MSYVDVSRLWSVSSNDVLPEDGSHEITAKEVYVFNMPRIMFRPGARFFNDLSEGDWSEAMYTLFLFFCEWIQRLKLQQPQNRDVPSSSPDLSIYLEVAEADANYCTGQRSNYIHPSHFNSPEEMVHTPQSDIFLPNVPEVNVAEYRIWVFVNDLDPLRAVADIIQEAEQRNNLSVSRVWAPRAAMRSSDTKLERWQQWMKIKNPEMFAKLLDNYTRSKRLSRAENIESLRLTNNRRNNNGEASNDPFNVQLGNDNNNGNIVMDMTHPLHPIHTFNPHDVFEYEYAEEPVCEIQSQIVNYRGGDNLTWKFPKPKNVLRLTPSSVNPHIIYNKYLLDIQKGFLYMDRLENNNASAPQRNPKKRRRQYIDRNGELRDPDIWKSIKQQDWNVPEEYTDDYRSRCSEFDSATLRSDNVLVGDRFEIVQSLTELGRIRILSEADMKIIQSYRSISLEKFRQAYLDHQNWVFSEFEATVMHKNSKLSDAGRAIVDHITQTSALSVKRQLPISDNRLDVFGNWVVSRMECFENLLFVYAAHRHFFLFSIGALDAFRYSFGLHLNAFAIGQSATSKSFIFDLMERCSVPNTIKTITYQSLKADASDDNDQNDAVTIMNEVSLSNYSCKDSFGGTNPETMMKEKLTSQKVRAKILEILEDGTRKTKYTLSECIGCWFGASNDDPSTLTESFWSRFHWAMFQMIHRPNRDIVSLAEAENRLTAEEREQMSYYVEWFKQLQCLHWLVEKLIMTGGLTDVSLTVTNTIINHVNKYLSDHNVECHSRTFERMRILSRLLTIHTALHYLYFVPIKILSPEMKMVDNFQGKPFMLEQLKYIDVLLRDEESIAIFVLGLMKDQIINPIEDIIRKALRKEHDRTRTLQNRYLQIGTATENTEEDIEEPQKKKSKKKKEDDDDEDVPQSMHDISFKELSSMKSYSSLLGGNVVPQYDYSYLRIKFNKSSIPKFIESHYAETPKPSVFQIKAVWEDMCKRSSYTYVYKVNPCPNGQNMFPVRDTDQEQVYTPLVKLGEHCVFVHADLLNNNSSETNVLREAIESTMHRFTRRRKVIYGEQHDVKYPNLFSVLEMKPKPDKILKARNVLYMNRVATKMLFPLQQDTNEVPKKIGVRDIPVFFMGEDLDTYGCGKRLDVLGILQTPLRIKFIHPKYFAEAVILKCGKSDVVYPESYIKSQEEMETRTSKFLVTNDLRYINKVMPQAISNNSRVGDSNEEIKRYVDDELNEFDDEFTKELKQAVAEQRIASPEIETTSSTSSSAAPKTKQKENVTFVSMRKNPSVKPVPLVPAS